MCWSAATQTKSTLTEGEVNIEDGVATFGWVINGDTVTFTLKANKLGWWGIGFGSGVNFLI
jgi:hypothetical protein